MMSKGTLAGAAAFLMCAGFLAAVFAAGDGYAQSSTPRDSTWVANGDVSAIAVTPTVTYIGGSFNYVGPHTGNAVAIDAATGSVNLPYPKLNGAVYACAADGSGGWYVGGTFTQAGSVPRNNLAHVLSDGSVDAVWNPGADGMVNVLSVVGATVYVGGAFANIGGQARNRLAALDAATGLTTAWNPNVNGTVNCLAISGGIVYVGGGFSNIGGQPHYNLSAVDATTGLASAWAPNPSLSVYALAVSGNTVYAGGAFDIIGGQDQFYLAAVDATTGLATSWNPHAGGQVYAIALSGNTVYLGGRFASMGGQTRRNLAALDATTALATGWNPNAGGEVRALSISGDTVYVGGLFTTVGGQNRNRVAALDRTTGLATAWDPNATDTVRTISVSGGMVYAGGDFTSIGGKTRHSIAALDTTTGVATDWNPDAGRGSYVAYVYSLDISNGTVYAGGYFANIGGQARNNIAALDGATGLATDWNPNADSSVGALAVSGGTVYAGGDFANIGSQPRNSVAALDAATGLATNWNPDATTGDPISHANIYTMSVSSGTVYVGGEFTSIGGQARNCLAALDGLTGLATDWNPDPREDIFGAKVSALLISGGTIYVGGYFSLIGGQARYGIAALDTATGSATDWNPSADNGVEALSVFGGTVYAGGYFTSIGHYPRAGIAALDAATGVATDWNPGADSTISALAAFAGAVYVGGYFTSIGGEARRGFAQFDPLPPDAPTNLGAIVDVQNQITWTWSDNSNDEDGFKVWAAPGAGPPTTLRTTTAANVESWDYTDLAANAQYAFQVAAMNIVGESARTNAYAAWTLIEPVTDLTFTANTDTLHVASSNTPSNLSAGTSGLQFANTTAGTNSDWQQDMTPWASSGLTPNTQYEFTGKSRNGESVTTEAVTGLKYTLAGPPSFANNVTCDKSLGTLYPAGTTFTFSNPAGFGAGTHGGNAYRASKFKQAWDTNTTYTFTGTETDWNTGPLAAAPSLSGDYYLHLQSFNQENVAGGTLDYGPFALDAAPPAAPVITAPNGGGDFLTKVAALTLSGTCAADTNAVQVNGSDTGVTYTPGALTWSYSTTLATQGANLFSMIAFDLATNMSEADIITVTYDNIAPAAPVITAPNSGGDFTTKVAALTLSGTCAADTDAIEVGDSAMGVTYTPGALTWSYSTTLATQGANLFSVTAFDLATNVSTPDTITVTFDNIAPAAPVITAPNSGNDFTTDAAALILNGTCAADTNAIQVGDSATGVTYTPGATTWSYSTMLSTEGANLFSVTAIDLATNVSAADTITVTYDSIAPVPVAGLIGLGALLGLLTIASARKMRKK